MTTAHTATPWALNRDEVPPLIYANHNDENGQKCIALFDGHAAFPDVQTCEANAEFIVRACNAYDKDQETIADLVKALQESRSTLANAIKANWEGATDADVVEHATIKKIDTALAKAGAA